MRVPYFYFKEIVTPLKLVGIRFFRDDENHYWIKIWGFRRRRL